MSSAAVWTIRIFLIVFATIGIIDVGARIVASPSYTTPVHAATGAITPTTLSIPTLGITARVQHVGTTANGRMAVPDAFDEAGWFREGSRPGEAGNAVLAGHLDDGWGLSAVFADLHTLESGDRIVVGGADGYLIYRVTTKQLYDVDEAPREHIFEGDGVDRLVLITCDGAWDHAEKQYDKRLVIFAERVR